MSDELETIVKLKAALAEALERSLPPEAYSSALKLSIHYAQLIRRAKERALETS